LKALGTAWPDVQNIVNKPTVSATDLISIQSIVAKKVSGGFFKKAAQSFGITTQPYQGLAPDEIVDALGLSESVLRGGGVMLERKKRKRLAEALPPARATGVDAPNSSPTAKPEPAQAIQSTDSSAKPDEKATQKLEKVKTAMSALHQFASGASGTAKTGGSQVAKPTNVANQTSNTSSAQGTETAGTGPTSGNETTGQTTGNVAAELKKIPLFAKQNDKALQNLANAIDQAGYRLVKK